MTISPRYHVYSLYGKRFFAGISPDHEVSVIQRQYYVMFSYDYYFTFPIFINLSIVLILGVTTT